MSDDEIENVVIVNEKKNYIYFNGPVEAKHVRVLISELHHLEEEELQKVDDIEITIRKHNRTIKLEREKFIRPIKLFITSCGGFVYQAWSVVDVIENMQIPVHTICQGFVASAATLISLAGHERYMTKNAYMLIHELRDEYWGTFSFLKDSFENSQNLMDHIVDYYVKKSTLSRKQILESIRNELTWNSEKCLEYGFVDKLYE